jgi:methyltransferase (TIGR00027 family)
METKGFSKTALMTAICRAAHMMFDDNPKILRDPIALKFLSEEVLAALHSRDPMLMAVANPFTRVHFCLRSRVAEDCMARSAAGGVDQFIILGAGLDSFAYRQPAWARRCRLVEVDEPTTQNAKIELIRSRDLGPPDNVIYLSADLVRESLIDRLDRTGIDATRPVFVSWLGVSQYLPADAVSNVLRALAGWRGGCGIVMTYMLADWSNLQAEIRAGAERTRKWAASVGEPWLSFFSEATIIDVLRSAGFVGQKPFTGSELRSIYLRHGHAFDVTANPSRIIAAYTSLDGASWFDLQQDG